ncbi:glutamyl-tRNA reductase [Paenibacillus turpanensis]|uniref:glutamyl-tRNA reductase n=1 Tax=Paenibacillus turpanensis TaxID=2689078 RepID=UPI00140DA4F5|nr:glutamyl-tRNA reductase [Paenibacillus turpanensis]
MHIIAVGLNYRTAPVEVREKFTIAAENMPLALQQLIQTKSMLECVIVATCNRTEIYAIVDRFQICGQYVRSFMEKWFHIPRAEFNNHLYIYEDERAIEHLMRVACGLDSMVLGETQILGQVKDAFQLAQSQGVTGTIFNQLFKQAITVAKRAHSETTIGENAVSVSYAAIELGKRIFGDFSGKKVLIVGAGKMSELTVKHLKSNGAAKVMVVNRTKARAEELAEKIGGVAYDMSDISSVLREADVVISSTGAKGYVLSQNEVRPAVEERASRPLFMIDIAVPRDLDPALSDLPNVYLYDIDDLEGIVEANMEQRRKEADKIAYMIREEMDAFKQWNKLLGVSPVIRALQEKAAEIHEETMASLLNKLPGLSEREQKALRKITKSMLNQLTHDPILRIKEMAADKGGDEALKTFTAIFALEERLAQQELNEISAASAKRVTGTSGEGDKRSIVAKLAAATERLARI